jgi:hypothetical protein
MVPAVLDVPQKPLLILPLVSSCPYFAFASSFLWERASLRCNLDIFVAVETMRRAVA